MNLYGIFGWPASHSLSPFIHNAGFREIGFKGYYLFLETPPVEFKKILQAKKRIPLSGFNLTVPFKEVILPYLDSVSPEVKVIGACNTVVAGKGRWRGYNTDTYGFSKGLDEKQFNPKDKSVVVIGAGGAARAILYVLLKRGIRCLIVLNRTLAHAQKLVEEFSRSFPDCLYGAASLNSTNARLFLSHKDLIVNTTSLGLHAGDPSPVTERDFPNGSRKTLVYDLIYSPRTSFLKIAQKKGYLTQDGFPMLFHQGLRNFELWTGHRAPQRQMREALEKYSQPK